MIGTVLAGKYRIMSLIGIGGMSNVYKATQILGAHRIVAIKVLKEEYEQDEAFLRRFQQEAQAVLSLSHESIVRSYDVGEADGHHFIVLEYVEGSTLKERIKEKGSLLPQRAVHISVQILDALAHAHEKGFIHRDVKPQNVIVNQRGRAKLADFGIARDASASTVTFAGANILGSVHYLSPEQAKGRPVTVEGDIYSMGITLYEMVTGELPFTGDTPVSIALKHLQSDVPAPNSVNSAVPRALSDVIVKATRRDPAARYHSAKAMRQDLLRALREPEGDFVHLADRPQSPGKKRRRPRGVWRIGLMVLVSLGLFTVVFLMGQALLSKERVAGSELVPTLLGKTYEEAQSIAKRRAYTLTVEGTQSSDEYDPGVVVSQRPDPSAPLKSGSTISIILSEGVEMPEVPSLTGMTLGEAEAALNEAELLMAEPEYRISEFPVGTVYQQDPVAGTKVFEGDTVRVFLSGEPSQNIEMPLVTGLSLEESLSLLQERGFSAFRVRYGTPEDDMDEGVVYLQSPAKEERIPETAAVTLTVCKVLPMGYGAEVTFRADILEDATHVVATAVSEIEGIPYERILYEAALDAGEQQNISFTAMSDLGQDQEVILYVGGKEVRRTNVLFSYWG